MRVKYRYAGESIDIPKKETNIDTLTLDGRADKNRRKAQDKRNERPTVVTVGRRDNRLLMETHAHGAFFFFFLNFFLKRKIFVLSERWKERSNERKPCVTAKAISVHQRHGL